MKAAYCRSLQERAHSSPLSAKYRRVFKGFRVEDSHINRKRKAADIESFRGEDRERFEGRGATAEKKEKRRPEGKRKRVLRQRRDFRNERQRLEEPEKSEERRGGNRKRSKKGKQQGI